VPLQRPLSTDRRTEVPEGPVHAIGVGFAMSGKLAAVFSHKFYAQEQDLGNKHPKRVIDLLVSLDASHNIDKIGRCD
jgi:hypothetical protein